MKIDLSSERRSIKFLRIMLSDYNKEYQRIMRIKYNKEIVKDNQKALDRLKEIMLEIEGDINILLEFTK